MHIHDLDFILTNSCNLKCPYCDHTFLYNSMRIRNFSENDFMKFSHLIRRANIISLSGGEPGLNTRETLRNFLNVVSSHKKQNAKLYLYTNGLFIKRYPDFCDVFDLIVVHLAPEPNQKHIDFMLKYHRSNMIYHVVLHRQNFDSIKDFLELWKENYPLLRIGIFTSDVVSLRQKFELDSSQIHQFINYISNKSNLRIIYEKAKLIRNRKLDYYMRMYCFHYRSNMIIDLDEQKIIRCCWMNPPKALHLSEIESIFSKSFNTFNYDACKNCNHVNINFKDLQFMRWLSKHVGRMGIDTRL